MRAPLPEGNQSKMCPLRRQVSATGRLVVRIARIVMANMNLSQSGGCVERTTGLSGKTCPWVPRTRGRKRGPARVFERHYLVRTRADVRDELGQPAHVGR